MSQNTPQHILCAVRSRPAGKDTVNRAIETAVATGARLTFFQIVDIGFLNRFSSAGSSRKAALRELTDMVEFALSIICEQAEAKGVVAADYVVRVGQVRQEILALATEMNVDLLVMGRPKQMPGRSAFSDQTHNEFIAQLEAAGVTVAK